MADSEWWASTIPAKLQQGDILRDIPFVLPAVPLVHLAPKSIKGVKEGFEVVHKPAVDHNKRSAFKAVGAISNVMLLNYGCDYDKQFNSHYWIAKVHPVEALQPSQRDGVLEQKNKHSIYLPDVPNLGDSFVDLRLVSTVDKTLIDEASVVASMTHRGRIGLQARLALFLFRVDWEDLLKDLADANE